LRPSTSRTWPGSNGSIIRVAAAIRRIHLSDLINASPQVRRRNRCGGPMSGRLERG
jgi:hypothetical protein